MRWQAGQDFINKLKGKHKNRPIWETYMPHKIYNKIYFPYYQACEISPREHDIYNKDGKKMRTFFIRDYHFCHVPNCESKYFIWDRFNVGLKNHFYTHKAMLETMGKPDHRFGMLLETPGIVPHDYEIFDKHAGLNKDFDLIFTYSEKILDKYDNARFVPFCGSVWGYEELQDNPHLHKTKNVSILSSNKLMCELHKFRYDLAFKCKKEKLADTFGTFDGGGYVSLVDTLKDYRYSICIENIVTPYLFTERLSTALAAGCVPLYLGAEKIDQFFNPDGIIKITPQDDIEKILKQCTKEEYERRMPAVIDNMERVKKYINCYDYMAEHYLMNIINEKA